MGHALRSVPEVATGAEQRVRVPNCFGCNRPDPFSTSNTDSSERAATTMNLTREQWELVVAIHGEARHLAADCRTAFIIDRANGDPAIAREVEAMLRDEGDQERTRDRRFDAALEAGPGATRLKDAMGAAMADLPEIGAAGDVADARFRDIPDDRLPPGTKVGGYVIERLIDAGGMGLVYEARQAKPARSVALKIMRLGLPSRSAMRRFEYESEILARLQHPNIAQVFEAGMHYEESVRAGGVGVPYFAMEFISSAKSIVDYADAHNLNTRARVELFRQVCDAVQHGHQKGIVHRDLKPSNILVDGEGRVKVIDFGVAKATESDIAVTTIATSVGQLIGTVQYMSPEQCSGEWGEVDTRSDVYALGVILYQLLCRIPPYEVSTTSLVRATRAVCEAEVRRPREVRRELRGSLEAVLLKSVERVPERRYAHAGDLSADLERWLRGDPVEARGDGPWSRATRWMRRHPIATTAFACVLMVSATVTGVSLGTWYAAIRPSSVRQVAGVTESDLQILSANSNVLDVIPNVPSFALVDKDGRPGGVRHLAYTINHMRDETRQALMIIETFKRRRSRVAAIPMPERSPDWAPEWLESHGADAAADTFTPNILTQDGAEIFPESPGREIIIRWAHHPSFACMIAIYSFDGTLLYHRWHRGHIEQVHWMSDERLLIFAGFRNDRWLDEIHNDDAKLRDYRPARVAFALRPELNAGHDDLPIWQDGDVAPGVLWYSYVAPIKVSGAMPYVETGLRPRASNQTSLYNLKLRLEPLFVRGDVQAVTLTIDSLSGAMISQARSHSYASLIGKPADGFEDFRYPDVTEISLRPYPEGLIHHSRDAVTGRWYVTDPQPVVRSALPGDPHDAKQASSLDRP